MLANWIFYGHQRKLYGLSSLASCANPFFTLWDNWSNVAKICNFTSFGPINFEQAKINFQVNTGCRISIQYSTIVYNVNTKKVHLQDNIWQRPLS